MDAHEYTNRNNVDIHALSLYLHSAKQVKCASAIWWVLDVGRGSNCLTIVALKMCVKIQNNNDCDSCGCYKI